MTPVIVADVDPSMRISRQELFGPAIAVTPVADIDAAIASANDTSYGLGAGVFTRDVNHALRFAREAKVGGAAGPTTSPLFLIDSPHVIDSRSTLRSL